MLYLLDTNAVIALVENSSERLSNRILTASSGDIGLPSVVIHELAFGAYRSHKIDFNLSTLQMLMRDWTVVDFSAEDAIEAGQIRATLKRAGTPIGPYDVLIAGQAKARNLCLVTDNLREFSRVAGLRVEDWTTG